MIASNVLTRVFFICADMYGTAFTIDVEGRQYLVTARHLLDTTSPIEAIKVFWKSQWITVPVHLVGAARGEVDVAVLATTSIRLSPSQILEPTTGGMIIGQDMYFVGYPYKMWTKIGEAMGGGPFPFVRRGTLSSGLDTGDGVVRLYIDAINNEGFSGSPLVFCPPENPRPYPHCVAGIISKYKIEYENVVDSSGNDTGLTVAYNTGFTIAYDIKYALALIKANPIGYPIEADA